MKKRVESLDAFRGLAVCGMILVNILAFYTQTPAILKHAHWTGLTLADLVFPFFLFIVGVSMSYSFAARVNQSAFDLWGHFLFRVLVLFLIGVALGEAFFLRGIPNIVSIRIPGVLQFIALSSLFAAPLARRHTRGVIAVVICLLLVQTIILSMLSVPGVPAGSWDAENNIAGWVDARIWGSSHLYSADLPPEGDDFDPEGLIALLNGVAVVLIGLLSGRILRQEKKQWHKIRSLLVLGLLMVLAGFIVSLQIPVIKQLWTASFVLICSGLAALILSLLYIYMDIKNQGRFLKIFAVPFGRNALIIYILSVVPGFMIFNTGLNLYGMNINLSNLITPVFFNYLGSQLGIISYGLLIIFCWWLLAYVMDRKGVYIKL